MQVGDYVRTLDGIKKIVKYEYRPEYENCHCIWFENENCGLLFTDKELLKSSPRIIELIQAGDYVNGLPVESVEGTWEDENDKSVYYGVATYGHKSNLPYHTYIVKDEFENDYDLRFRSVKPNEIKSIVTKEQFKSMEYKIGD